MKDKSGAAFWAVLIAACCALLAYAIVGVVEGQQAQAEESKPAEPAPTLPVSDEQALEQEHRSHSVEAVEAGKVDAEGNPIDGEKKIVTFVRERMQQRLAELAANAAEEEPEAEQATEYEPEEYLPQEAYYSGYSGGSTATTLSDLLNIQGKTYDEGGTSYTYYVHDLGNGPLDIPGEHFDDAGVSYDADGYIVVAADGYATGDVISTPYGDARVYDHGSGYGNIDIYTNR